MGLWVCAGARTYVRACVSVCLCPEATRRQGVCVCVCVCVYVCVPWEVESLTVEAQRLGCSSTTKVIAIPSLKWNPASKDVREKLAIEVCITILSSHAHHHHHLHLLLLLRCRAIVRPAPPDSRLILPLPCMSQSC